MLAQVFGLEFQGLVVNEGLAGKALKQRDGHDGVPNHGHLSARFQRRRSRQRHIHDGGSVAGSGGVDKGRAFHQVLRPCRRCAGIRKTEVFERRQQRPFGIRKALLAGRAVEIESADPLRNHGHGLFARCPIGCLHLGDSGGTKSTQHLGPHRAEHAEYGGALGDRVAEAIDLAGLYRFLRQVTEEEVLRLSQALQDLRRHRGRGIAHPQGIGHLDGMRSRSGAEQAQLIRIVRHGLRHGLRKHRPTAGVVRDDQGLCQVQRQAVGLVRRARTGAIGNGIEEIRQCAGGKRR